MNSSLKKLEWDKAASLINEAQKIVIIGHARPDSDAIGSIVAMALALESLNKQVIMAVDGGSPPNLQFLLGAKRIKTSLEETDLALVICVDSSDIEVMGETGQFAFGLNIPKLVIDHHITNEFYGDVHLVDSTAVSTTEILYHLFEKLRVEISPDIANCLLTGIIMEH